LGPKKGLIELIGYKIHDAGVEDINNIHLRDLVYWVYVYSSTMEGTNRDKHRYKEKSNRHMSPYTSYTVEGIVSMTYIK
jgi:hypothetical protein